MIYTSGVELVSTTPECTSRRSRPKLAPSFTTPPVTPNIDILVVINKCMVVDWTVLHCFIGVFVCRHFYFYMTFTRCVIGRRSFTGKY